MEISCAMDWLLPASLFLLVVLLAYIYGTWTFSTFTRNEIPGPPPLPFFGHVLEFRRKGIFDCVRTWRKKYGKSFGIYMMRQPLLLTCDLDIAKEVFIKDFANFTNRGNKRADTFTYPLNLSLPFTEDNTWRRLRHTMTPTFSTGKLKLMAPCIARCCENLSRALLRITEKQELVDVKRVFGAYTIDVIAGTAFGLETDMLTNENEAFVQCAMQMIRKQSSLGLRIAFFMLFPFIGRFLRFAGLTKSSSEDHMIHFIDKIIQERRNNGGSDRNDFIQLLLEAEASEKDIALILKIDCTQILIDRHSLSEMTKDEIIAQGVTIINAGYETTATTLHFMVYLLALNPDKQEKLYDEIMKAIGNDTPTYDNVMGIKYLDDTLRETLRMFPPTPMLTRSALETRTIKGLTIEAGSTVGVASAAFMQDEEIFPEPDKFIPERFDDDNIPTIVRELAFGMGPRQCIGMRLAL
ncbi:cytochrome P450 3A6-like [Pomacea canaliculata]|uniref:cytochrome P450 3A6-like n=1 Tax=Pomacea canaliculata TaxID=400727 RepID=UPI000D7373BC|nr:cytochrome P450 3A6-like [Pomacea canaliculata]